MGMSVTPYHKGYRYNVKISEEITPENYGGYNHPFKTFDEARKFAVEYMKENPWL